MTSKFYRETEASRQDSLEQYKYTARALNELLEQSKQYMTVTQRLYHAHKIEQKSKALLDISRQLNEANNTIINYLKASP